MENKKTSATKALGQTLRQRRKVLDLTQEQLGQLAGCGLAFIYELERGKPTVRLDKLLDVMIVLGLQLSVTPGKGIIAIDERLK